MKKLIQTHYTKIILIILIGSFATKLINLHNPPEFYFDEVYHGYTATQYLEGNPDAYDPWAPSPEGKANEWTHPPLAKLIMAGIMLFTGPTSFGWRLGSVIFGTGAIALAAWLALRLTNSKTVSLLTAFLISLEGLAFAMSRIAMNDAYFLFFMLATVLAYVYWLQSHRYRYLLIMGLVLGGALASKWTTFYLIGILGLHQLSVWLRPLAIKLLPLVKGEREGVENEKSKSKSFKLPTLKDLFVLVVSFIFLPAAIYLLSYTQYFFLDFTWSDFIEVQRQMWWYHTNLEATHSYQSVPWQWLLNVRPVWMHVNHEFQDKIANIYNIGNSIILISGLGAIAYLIVKQIKNWTWQRSLILMAYFLLWLPWAISPRIMFFYHYLPAVPFLVIALSTLLNDLIQSGKSSFRYLALGLISLSAVWFVLFYPHQTALPVPKGFAETVYQLIPSWK